MSGGKSERSLDVSNDISAELLLLTLGASRAGLFYSPMSPEVKQVDSYSTRGHIPDQAWSLNIGALFGMTESPKDAQAVLPYILESDRHILMECVIKAISERIRESDCEYRIRRADSDEVRWLMSRLLIGVDERGNARYLASMCFDITERKLAEERMQYIATHDVLTGLPNRYMFNNLLNHTIETTQRYSSSFALLFIDLDRFKAINDAFGHQVGDQLLIEMSQRIQRSLRSSDVLARISGDEFVVLAPDLGDEEGAAGIARRIIAEASQSMMLLGQNCQISASIGICFYPRHGDDEKTLMRNADAAMYAAKEAGKNNYQFYSADNISQSLERMAIENELRSALENNQLSLQYQAKLDLRSNKISGVEALLRWNSPKFGSISPAIFIPIAEETGCIVSIGRWVLMEACKNNVEWQKQGMPPICMAVNISARQFIDKNLLDNIQEALDASGMDPALLELEITESMMMYQVDKAIALLSEIKKLGGRIAIDDFGTGYSSLAQLKRFPIDTLKIDRSFIREVTHDRSDQAITEAIIAMGKSLSLTIVAEGVETKEQQDFLRSRACDEMQGFYFSKPLPPHEFMELLRHHSVFDVCATS